jgi:hypothetical protein
MSNPMETSRYVVKLNSDTGRGLGVVVQDRILTCAHLFEIFKATRNLTLSLSAEIPGEDSPSEYFVQTLDCLLDFMVLGYNPIDHEIVGDLQFGLEQIEPPLKPASLEFPKDLNRVQLPVYFFAHDGTTVIHANATISRHSPTICIEAKSEPGCSGGPIFTADHRLIGILQGGRKLDGDEEHTTRATRIDLAATEWLRRELGGFAPLDLGQK